LRNRTPHCVQKSAAVIERLSHFMIFLAPLSHASITFFLIPLFLFSRRRARVGSE